MESKFNGPVLCRIINFILILMRPMELNRTLLGPLCTDLPVQPSSYVSRRGALGKPINRSSTLEQSSHGNQVKTWSIYDCWFKGSRLFKSFFFCKNWLDSSLFFIYVRVAAASPSTPTQRRGDSTVDVRRVSVEGRPQRRMLPRLRGSASQRRPSGLGTVAIFTGNHYAPTNFTCWVDLCPHKYPV